MIINILAFIFVLGVLIVIHEAGHFAAARLVGAKVEVFSVGFGKRLWGFQRGDTDYRVSLIPFGGYVRIVGLGPDESDLIGESAEHVVLIPRWQRAFILVAGPLTNIVGAVVFLSIAFVLGIEVPAYQDSPPVVGWIEPESPAASTDLQMGDRIVSMDGVVLQTWRDLDMSTMTSSEETIDLVVERNGEMRTISLTPKHVTRYAFGYSGILPPLDPVIVRLIPNQPAALAGLEVGDRIVEIDGNTVEQFYDLFRYIGPYPEEELPIVIERGAETLELKIVPRNEGGEGKIGIALVFPSAMKRLGLIEAFVTGSVESYRMTIQTFRILGRLLTGNAPLSQVSGPLDIAWISGEAARSGIRTLIWFLGLISLQLGIFNLLPIPVLDGGHLTIIAFETTIRRDLSLKLKERILEVGFYLLMALMVVVLFNDIKKRLPESLYNYFFG
ncbi:MAG: RIP metalloprotease RseP [bacterium]|nr:RIP metalloprotease RseP [bacterium]